MKIIITEKQYTIIDWFIYHKNLFDKIFNHYVYGDNTANYFWFSNDIDYICDNIIKDIIKKFEYIKITNLEKDHYDFLMSEYRDRIVDRFNEIRNDYSKTFINESKGSNVVKQILDSEDIKLKFEYVTKSRTGIGTEYHNIWLVFTYPDDTKIVGMSFKIKDNDIMVHGYGGFNDISESFKYLPKNVVTDYFVGKGIEYLVNYLKNN